MQRCSDAVRVTDLVHHDVLGLNIAVDKAVFVEVLDGEGDLRDIEPGLRVVEVVDLAEDAVALEGGRGVVGGVVGGEDECGSTVGSVVVGGTVGGE